MFDAPSAAENIAQCAAQCTDEAGCRGFNFASEQLLCELVSSSCCSPVPLLHTTLINTCCPQVKLARADADPSDFDTSAEASGWNFYEPEVCLTTVAAAINWLLW